MHSSFMVYPFKFFISLFTSIFSFILSAAMLIISRPGSFCLFLVIGILFLAVALLCGSRVCFDEQGVSHVLFHKTLQSFSWENIAEVGIAGSKVFRNDNKKDVGSRYLYFSKQALTDDERFQMMLQWPPRDKIYLQYNETRLAAIQTYWSGSIATYKAGDVFL